ncbi:molybdopterin-dependent oxidoreductase [Robertmurraya massiliosenegalensis]
MNKHLKTLRNKQNKRINLGIVIATLLILIISGVLLTFHRMVPPVVSTWSLIIHDVATWVGLPYIIYHSVTRSKWFKKLERHLQKTEKKEEPMLIEANNPIYKRRTFLRMASGSIIVLLFSSGISKWLTLQFPTIFAQMSQPKSQPFSPLPRPTSKSMPPIGGGRKGEFRYFTVTETPQLNTSNWNLKIDGLVESPNVYNWERFLQLKRYVQVSDFHCVTGWSVYSGTWEGILLSELLRQVGVKKDAQFVKFYSADGVYTDTLSLEQAKMDDVMVAVLIDGELITEKNGGPVRLIVPQMYAYKSVKWLNRIELINHEHIGYWEERGYAQNAWVNNSKS